MTVPQPGALASARLDNHPEQLKFASGPRFQVAVLRVVGSQQDDVDPPAAM